MDKPTYLNTTGNLVKVMLNQGIYTSFMHFLTHAGLIKVELECFFLCASKVSPCMPVFQFKTRQDMALFYKSWSLTDPYSSLFGMKNLFQLFIGTVLTKT